MHVWVQSSSHITAAALAELLRVRGFSASTRRESVSEVALWDLTGWDLTGWDLTGWDLTGWDSSSGNFAVGLEHGLPLPLPTLALVPDERVGALAFRLGYRGYLTRRAGGGELERALLALSKGQMWVGDHPLLERNARRFWRWREKKS